MYEFSVLQEDSQHGTEGQHKTSTQEDVNKTSIRRQQGSDVIFVSVMCAVPCAAGLTRLSMAVYIL